jgi:hypothetical protein
LNAPDLFLAEHFCSSSNDEVHARASSGTLHWLRRFRFCRPEANRRALRDEYTKTEIWDLAAGTFIAVSVVRGMAFIIASAIH